MDMSQMKYFIFHSRKLILLSQIAYVLQTESIKIAKKVERLTEMPANISSIDQGICFLQGNCSKRASSGATKRKVRKLRIGARAIARFFVEESTKREKRSDVTRGATKEKGGETRERGGKSRRTRVCTRFVVVSQVVACRK